MLNFFGDVIVCNYSLCQQCGICVAVCPTKAINYTRKKNGLCNIHINQDECIRCKKCIKHCPSNIQDELDESFLSLKKKSYYFGYNRNSEIRRNSSSGGVAKTLIIEALKNELVDGVYSLQTSSSYPYAEGVFYSKENIPEFDNIPNSVYHSILLNENIDKIRKCDKLMVVGTSCQLKGLDVALKGKYKKLIKVCIFCKQQKTLYSTRFLGKMTGESISLDKEFRFSYRGMGWPGVVQINNAALHWDIAARLPFGRRLWSVPGCRICGNPFGNNVDLSLMDPWSIRNANDFGDTLVTVHTRQGDDLLKNTPGLIIEAKSYCEIERALGLKDIARKQALIPFFKNERCGMKVKIAGIAEQTQEWFLRTLVTVLPRLPLVVYKIINKLPDLRNIILR